MNLLNALTERQKENAAALVKLQATVDEVTTALQKRQELQSALTVLIAAERAAAAITYTVAPDSSVIALTATPARTHKAGRQDRTASRKQVLDAVCQYGQPIAAVDIARLTGISRMEVGRLLYEAEHKGILSHTGTQGAYLYSAVHQ